MPIECLGLALVTTMALGGPSTPAGAQAETTPSVVEPDVTAVPAARHENEAQPEGDRAAALPPEEGRPKGTSSEAPPDDGRRVNWWDVPSRSPRRWSAGGHFETQLIGLSFGLRAEAMYRPFRATRGFNLRLGVGLLGGPEFFYLPVDVGWRQHFVPHRVLTLELGAGFEQQSFFVPGIAPVSRSAFYGEGGFAFRVHPSGWLGLQTALSWAPFARPGPGLALRLGFRWDFGTP